MSETFTIDDEDTAFVFSVKPGTDVRSAVFQKMHKMDFLNCFDILARAAEQVLAQEGECPCQLCETLRLIASHVPELNQLVVKQ